MRAVERVGRLAARAAYRIGGVEGVAKLLLFSVPGVSPAILRAFGAHIGARAVIHSPLLIANASGDFSNLTLGEDCHTGKDVLLDLAGRVTMGHRVTVSMGARVITHLDAGASRLATVALPRAVGGVTLEDDVYVGANAVILHGVTIGRCAAIGAGAVVIHDVPPFSVAVGAPARVVRTIPVDQCTAAGFEVKS